MNDNEDENQREEAISASESSLDEEVSIAPYEKLNNTEHSPDDPDDVLDGQGRDDAGDTAESGKDWLVDTGLAAAINPQSDDVEDPSEETDLNNANQGGAESDLYEDDDEDGSWEEYGSESDDYEEDLAEVEDGEDFDDDEQAPLVEESAKDHAHQARAVWPMVVGGIALMLIGVGGWDLFEQRATLQSRIIELEESLSRTRESEALDAKIVAELEVENAALKLQLDTLYQDYTAAMAELSNTSINGGLAQDNAFANLAGDAEAESNPVTGLEAESQKSEKSEGSNLTPFNTGGWFINIGAYANSQSANTWVLRLESAGYDVSVTEIQTTDGATLNRVRLTGFDSKAVAKNVAQELETDYGTGPLWVGELTSAD